MIFKGYTSRCVCVEGGMVFLTCVQGESGFYYQSTQIALFHKAQIAFSGVTHDV